MTRFIAATAIFSFLTPLIGLSQSIQKEINDQVWRVQLSGMHTNDAALFMSVMSADVVQISHSRGTIRNYDAFRKQAIATYNRITERGLVRTMEFRFLKRIASESQAFDDGFFRYEQTTEKGEKSTFYGYFQVLFRKENGTWKIVMDYDAETYGGEAVTADQFNGAKSLEAYDN